MKFKILFLLIIIIFFTGCKANMTCTLIDETNNYKTVIEIYEKNNKIKHATATMIFDEEDSYNTMCELLEYEVKSNKDIDYTCNNKKIIIKKYQNLNESITYKDFISELTNNGYICKN